MAKEIDLLLAAESRGCLVVEKASNVVWERDALLDARADALFEGDARVGPLTEAAVVSGPFPGCLQMGAAPERGYQPLGETEHFVIFAAET